MSELHPPAASRRHLLSIGDLTRDDIERILETAQSLAASLDREMKKLPTLRGRTVVNLFYDSSTRTLASFEMAAKHHTADTMSISWAGSSVFRGKPGGEWKAVVENVKSPADIGWDSKRKRLLIPSFMGNSVTLNPLE